MTKFQKKTPLKILNIIAWEWDMQNRAAKDGRVKLKTWTSGEVLYWVNLIATMDVHDYTAESWPGQIASHCGAAFTIGTICGAVSHGANGFRNSRAGLINRARSSLGSIKTRAAATGGKFAVWGGLYSAFEASLIQIRGKEDRWNNFISGGATSGILAIRAGPKVIIRNVLLACVVVFMLESVQILLNRTKTHDRTTN